MTSFDWWEVEINFRVTGRGRIGADGLAFWYVNCLGFTTSTYIFSCKRSFLGTPQTKVSKVQFLAVLIGGMVLVYFLTRLIMTTNITILMSWQWSMTVLKIMITKKMDQLNNWLVV